MFVSFRKFQSRVALRRPTLFQRARKLIWIAIFVGAIGGGGWLLFQQTVHSQLRDRVQAKISEKFEATGLIAHLGQARFLSGKGIQLNNLTLELDLSSIAQHQNGNGRMSSDHQKSKVEIYEAFVHAPATITELASTELDINRVELRRVRLTLVRNSDGEWDFANIIDSLRMIRSDCDSPIPISLTDCEIRIIDHASSRSTPITLSNVNVFILPIEHDGKPQFQIRGGFQSPAISQIEFTTYLDQNANSWWTEVVAKDATLSGELVSILPTEIQSEFRDLQAVSARINFLAKATGQMTLDSVPAFEISGDVGELNIDDARLPLPIRRASASFWASNKGFVISKAHGHIGEAEFSTNYWQHGFLERGQWHCDGSVMQFEFDHNPRLTRWLPAYCKKFCNEYSPTGKSNIDFDLTHDGTSFINREVTGTLTDMAFTWIKFPYKVENCIGSVNWLGDVCKFDVRSLTGKQEIEFKGHAKGFGASPTYEIDISVPGALPIDQKMRDAIDAKPKLATVLRAFSPSGHLAGIGKIKKLLPNGPVSKSFAIRLKHCSMQHDKFGYPIHNIVGLVSVENDNYTFSELSGNNSSGKVTCNGTWNPINGLAARFICNSVPLNDQLRFALKPELQEIWKGFRPRGTLDFMRIDMLLPIGKELSLVVEAAMNKPKNKTDANYISINPTWFPYAIEYLTGSVKIEAGKITLKNIEAKHRRTWMACQGDGRYDDNSWSVKLKNLIVGSLKVDEDLLDAVPDTLAPPIRQLKFQGLLTVNGEVTVAGRSEPPGLRQSTQTATRYSDDFSLNQPLTSSIPRQPPSSSMAWDLRFDMNQAKMHVGVPVENVSGGVKLVGIYDGKNAECRGDLQIDSMTVYDAQITKIRGPIWLDNEHASAGQFARSQTARSSININNDLEGGAELNSVTGQMHQGTINFDAKLSSGSNHEYFVQATLNDGCLATACREFGSSLENVEGHSFAAVRLTGDYSGIHSRRGEGLIQLRDAKIYELPVFLSLLKILNVRQVSRTAFDSSNIEFTVQGDQIQFSRMEFLGDAISLIGNGTMNLAREIDLNFYSVMGRNRINIPLISDLYRTGIQKILWINVDGSLDNPQTHRHVLSGLNDSLQQLFQPRERTSLAQRLQKGSLATPNNLTPNSRSSLIELPPSNSQSRQLRPLGNRSASRLNAIRPTANSFNTARNSVWPTQPSSTPQKLSSPQPSSNSIFR